MGKEVAREGIRVNCIRPGHIDIEPSVLPIVVGVYSRLNLYAAADKAVQIAFGKRF